jgi:predicted RND superfamily exporter protein
MKSTFYGRNALLILMITAFLMPWMWVGTRRGLLSNKNDVKSWLPSAYEETTTYKWYRERFESDMFILVSWEGCTLDDERLPLLVKKLIPPVPEKDPNGTYILHPASGSSGPAQAQEPHRFFRRALTSNDLLNELVERQGLEREEAIERLKHFVIGPDGKQACLVLTVNLDVEPVWEGEIAQGKHRDVKFFHAVVDKVYDTAEHECAIPRDSIHMGGPPIDNVAIDREGTKTLIRLAGVSAVVGLFMSWWCLRSWALTAMVFTTSLFCAGLSLAAVWATGTPMNCILLTMPSLVYVAGTSGAIHLANYYRDTVRQGGLEGAVDKTVKAAWLPLALATGTTAIGLLSMYVTELVPIRLFGVYSAIGVLISFVVLMTYTPALFEIWPLPHLAQPAERRFDPGLSPKWRGVGEFIIRHNKLMATACIALMIAGAWGVTRIETSVKLMRMFSADAQIINDYRWLEDKLGPLVPMEVVIRVDKSKCKLDMLAQVQMVSEVQKALAVLPDVGNTLAVPTFARNLPRRASMIERRTWIVQLEKNRAALHDYLQTDNGQELWRVSARVAALTSTDYGEFINDIRQAVEPVLDKQRSRGVEGISATYTGLVPLIYKAQGSLLTGLELNFVGDMLLIGVAIVFLMRSFSAGLLLMVPSLFPLALAFGAMGFLGVVVDAGTVMVPAVALGVTIDDAIHFMLWCRHGQERGMTKQQAIMFAYEDCARAIYQSWGVIGLGLSCFALSSFTPTQRFGYLMFIMLTLSSIGNLVLMPAMLAGPLGHFFWKQRKHKPAADTPHHEIAVVEPEPELVATLALPAAQSDAPVIRRTHSRHHKRQAGL